GFVDRIEADRVPAFLADLVDRLHSENEDVLKKIGDGDWSDEIQESLKSSVAEFADDFGYDLDEEGQPLDEDAEETRRTDDGVRSAKKDDDGDEDKSGEDESEASEDKEEAAATA
ncbi:MAG: hypothetical protein M3P44_03980, partial [Actinomycetota bacterium]|nr:hypothetical protein [Actinomycetota bacterium]